MTVLYSGDVGVCGQTDQRLLPHEHESKHQGILTRKADNVKEERGGGGGTAAKGSQPPPGTEGNQFCASI